MKPALNDPLPLAYGRVSLRRLGLADLPTFQAYRQDANVRRYQDWEPLSDRDAAQFITDMSGVALFPQGQWIQLGIADRSTNRLIGDLGICVSKDGSSAEVGFTLAAAAQGLGFGSDAVKAAIRLTFDHAPVAQIVAVTDARNLPALRLLERVSMRRVNTVAAIFRGQSCVEHVYAISRSGD
jgi:[ribosomal protein S5]-alanine N-acetyltransferase